MTRFTEIVSEAALTDRKINKIEKIKNKKKVFYYMETEESKQ